MPLSLLQVLSPSLPLSLAQTCFVLSLLNISKYVTFKPIAQLVLSYIDLATYLTLFVLELSFKFVSNEF